MFSVVLMITCCYLLLFFFFLFFTQHIRLQQTSCDTNFLEFAHAGNGTDDCSTTPSLCKCRMHLSNNKQIIITSLLELSGSRTGRRSRTIRRKTVVEGSQCCWTERRAGCVLASHPRLEGRPRSPKEKKEEFPEGKQNRSVETIFFPVDE